MPRAAAKEGEVAQKQAGSNAAGLFGPLQSNATDLVNSKGHDPATLGAITNAGMGGVNAAFGSAAGQVNRNAAKTGNSAGKAGQLDTLAQDKGIAGGQEAGDIQIQNANFANQQRTQGLNMLNSLYGTNVGSQSANLNSQIVASPGWTSAFHDVTSGIGSLIPK